MSRSAHIQRNTRETSVDLLLNIDGTGKDHVDTPLPFFTHMLTSFARHSHCDLNVTATGDIEVDGHHTVEDLGLCLGDALGQSLGDRAGIARFGHAVIPFDETLVEAVVDLGGRPAFVWLVHGLERRWIGNFDCELVREFWQAFVNRAQCNLHLRLHYGANAHHIVEATFKAAARAIRQAVAIDPGAVGVPSTKGTLTI